MFDGIPLDEVSTSMTINAPAAVLVAMYHVACRRQGRDPAQIRGTAQNDVLKEYVSRGTYIYPPRPSLRLAADLIAWTAPPRRASTRSRSPGYHMREAGCTAAQEMGFAVANAIAYVSAVVDRGVGVDEFAPAALVDLQHAHGLLRGDRQVPRPAPAVGARHARPVRRADPRSMMLRTHTQTGRLDAHAPAAREQHRAGGGPGARRGAGRRAVDGALVLRRGHRHPDRARPDAGGAHAADAPARVRHHRARPIRWAARGTSSG